MEQVAGRRRAWWLPVAVAVAACGCAKQGPKAVGVAPGTPYVSWIIMHGDRDNPDREFACQSHPRSDCVLPVSRPDAAVFSDVFVYYHGGPTETKYAGSVRVGFFQGSGGATEMKTDVTLRKNESIRNESVAGIVTASPGRYALSFALDATAGDPATAYPIRDEVAVVVQ